MRRLELLQQRRGDLVVLSSPAPGFFTCAEDKGRVLTPGCVAGVLRTLEVPRALVVPEGVSGLVANARPERVNQPVARGTPLFELTPLQGTASAGSIARDDPSSASSLRAFRAPHSGRFWHRASPKEPPFVKPGDVVVEGTVVGLIEVMKTFTHLHYAHAGALPARSRVVRFLAEDGVEIREGDPLIELESA